jgi:hypothetical protein
MSVPWGKADLMITRRRHLRSDFFRCAEISTEGIAGNRNPIVHTAAAFNPTAQKAAR